VGLRAAVLGKGEPTCTGPGRAPDRATNLLKLFVRLRFRLHLSRLCHRLRRRLELTVHGEKDTENFVERRDGTRSGGSGDDAPAQDRRPRHALMMHRDAACSAQRAEARTQPIIGKYMPPRGHDDREVGVQSRQRPVYSSAAKADDCRPSGSSHRVYAATPRTMKGPVRAVDGAGRRAARELAMHAGSAAPCSLSATPPAWRRCFDYIQARCRPSPRLKSDI
jgi:hypothetical protein